MKKPVSFAAIRKSKVADSTVAINQKPTEFGFLTVRLSKQDAKRFKRAAEDAGLTNQSGLVEAVNRMMVEWGESPVADHGTAGKG